MPTQDEFLNQLFGGSRKTRKIGEPLRRSRIEVDDDSDGIDFVSDAENFRKNFGLDFSSTFRSPERNQRVGGTSNSYHLKGQAADIPTAGMTADMRASVKQYWSDRGSYDVIDEGDHIHVEPRPGVKSSTSFGGSGISGSTGEVKSDSKQDAFLDQLFDPNAPNFSGVKSKVTSTETIGKPAAKERGLASAVADWAKEQYGPTKDSPIGSVVPKFIREPITRTADKVLTHVTNRFLTDIGQISPDDPRYSPTIGTSPTLETYKARDPFIGDRRIKDRAAQREAAQKLAETMPAGFWKNLRNPVDLLLSDSLPANFLEWANNSYERGYDRLVEAKKVQMQDNIAAHPEQFPAVSVQAAKKAIAERKAKQGRGVADAWNDLKKAASEDPGRFGAELINSLMADPEMIFAPIGIGLKPIQGTQKLAGVASGAEKASRVSRVAQRAASIADNITDAAVTGAGLNTVIEAAHAGSQGQDFTGRDAGTAAVTGAAFSGIFGAFMKGKSAREKLASGNVTQETFEQTLRDVAQEDLAVDEILTTKNPLDRSVKHRIEDMAGVKFESEADLKAYLKAQRAEWRKLFEERDLNGQYQKALADERISRRQTLLEEQEARSAREAAEGEKSKQVAQAYEESFAARMRRFNEDYEKAVAQRDAAADASVHEQALAENNLRDYQSRLDQEEIIAAAFEGDVPAIRNAMLNAAQRDAKLRVPKWQRGEVDPNIVARLGVGSLFAGTAYALADKENKPGAALAAGLAGLIIPAAGGSAGRRVLSRMSQAGVLDPDGAVVGLFKARDPAKQLEADTAVIARAKGGDKTAINELFNDNYMDIVRFANRKLKGMSGKLGMDGEDIASEVFTKAFAKLDQYESRVPYNAYLKEIAKNEIKMAFRSIYAEKRGADLATESMYNKFDSSDKTPALSGEDDGGYRSAIRGDVEGAAADFNSPEYQADFMETAARLNRIVDALPKKQQEVFRLLNIDNLSIEEVVKATGESLDNVYKMSRRAEITIAEMLGKDMGATPAPKEPTAPVVKRGRGRPRKETGEINQDLMRVLGAGTVGALIGQYLVDNKDKEGEVRTDPKAPSKIVGALAGAGMGVLLFGGAKARASVGRGAEYVYGASSTAILNRSKAIHKRILSTENAILTNTHKNLEQVDPFLVRLNKLPKEGADILARALMTGNSKVISKILDAFGDAELSASYKAVRSVLDSLGDKLVNLKRFSRGNIEYFPRVVKDKDGLFAAIGKKEADSVKGALDEANLKSLEKNGRPLSEIEESAIITRMLFTDIQSVQPGFTKNRGIEEITPELQQYYATPAESLHSYIRAAVQDIEGAKFFGDYAKNMRRGNNEYLNVDSSVKNLIKNEVESGQLSGEDAKVIADILRARFKEGMRAENDTIRNIKNIGNIGLLGNFWSAATQLADIPIQIYTQDLRSTLESIVRQVTGKKIVDMKDFGLADHVSEEFAGQLRTSRWVNKVFKASLFAGIDRFGKNTALNAAIIRAQRLAQSEGGQLKLANKYAEAYGKDFPQLVSDLKSGKVTDLTRDYAFMELSRTQPISRIEMPQAYLKHPNARSYLWLKSFTMKQLDLVRREAFNEIKKGDPKSIARGIKNLTELSIVLGLAGTGTDVVKDFLHNGVAALTGGEQKEYDVKRGDLFMNIFKTYGFSQYTIDKAVGVSREEAKERRAEGDKFARPTKPKPLDTLVEGFMQPAFISTIDSLFSGDQQKAMRLLIPGLGPYIAEQMKRAREVEKGIENE